LAPVTDRSRDNFPNPVTAEGNPYVPLNTPAIGDLFDLLYDRRGIVVALGSHLRHRLI
jgi:phospholipase C